MPVKPSQPAAIFPDKHRHIVPQKTKAKVLLLLLALLTLSANAFSQFESGTIVIVGYSKDKIIMAADSRGLEENGTHRDDMCKITALSDKFLFSAIGRFFDKTRGVAGWDATAQAKEAFAVTSKRPPVPGHENAFAGDLADEWAQIIGNNIAVHIRPTELASLKPNAMYLTGIFAGIGSTGAVQFASAQIHRRADAPGFFSPPIKEPPIPDTLTYAVFGGDFPIFLEFYEATSKRAKAEKIITTKQSKKWPFYDADARLVMRYVELMIKYVERPGLGGPIDAVEINKGSLLRWIQRKPNCRDN
jgi:hypothetical protein